MPWPTPQEYNEAIQNPSVCFADPDLKGAVVETTALGLPRPVTGNFASVYHLRNGTKEWAVRCFWREYADMGERYHAISRHLTSAGLPYTVGFSYLAQGIRVNGRWYPVLLMDWVDGVGLAEYVESNLGDPATLRKLANEWVEMVAVLGQARVAHGDLQHGNVLVAGGQLKLVDYDGMWVPALSGKQGLELGHPNYQHPGRAATDFGPHMDHFSAWSIYLSLTATAARAGLWDQLRGGDECLLLRRTDYCDPAGSPALTAFNGMNGEISPLARSLQAFLGGSPSAVPALEFSPEKRGRTRAHRVKGTGNTTVPSESNLPDWLQDYVPDSVHAPGRAIHWPSIDLRPWTLRGQRRWNIGRLRWRERRLRLQCRRVEARLRAVRDSYGGRLALIERVREEHVSACTALLRDLAVREVAAHAELMKLLRDLHISDEMRRNRLSRRHVPGLPLWMVLRLRAAGVHDAEAVERILRAPPDWLDRESRQVLQRWHNAALIAARQSAPTELTAEIQKSLNRRYGRPRKKITTSLERAAGDIQRLKLALEEAQQRAEAPLLVRLSVINGQIDSIERALARLELGVV